MTRSFVVPPLVLVTVVGAVCATVASAQPGSSAQTPAVGQATMVRAAQSAGRLDGVVTDEKGAPLPGAAVSVAGVESHFSITDRAGRFEFDRLPAGPYFVKANLRGFIASRRELVHVRSAAATSTRVSLTPVGAASVPERPILAAGMGVSEDAEEAAPTEVANASPTEHDHSPTAWRLRHLKRSVLRETENGVFGDATVDFGEQLLGPVHALSLAAAAPFSGQFNFLTISSFDSPQELFSGTRIPNGVAYVAITAPGPGDATWSVQGALTDADVSSWVLGGQYSTTIASAHATTVGVTYAAQRYHGGNPLALAAMGETSRTVGTMFGSDEWRIAPTMSVTVAARYAKHGYMEESPLFSPSFELRWVTGAHDVIRAAASQQMLAPGAEEFVPSPVAGMWMPPQRTFAPLGTEGFRAQRTRHLEIGYEREVGSLVLAARGFRQTVNEQIVAIFGLAVPDVLRSELGHYFTGSAGDVEAFGWGVGISRPVGSRLRGSVAYTLTHANWYLPPEAVIGLAVARALEPGERIHDLTTSVETEFPETATRVYAMYKINSAYSCDETFEAEPGLNVRFDVQVNQRLPLSFLGDTEWEVLVAVRNLFRDPVDGSSVYDELFVIRPPKRIIGGLLLRF